MYTKSVHAGSDPEHSLGSLSSPIYHSSLFAFSDAEEGSAIHEGEKPGYFYGRMGNPTQTALQTAVADLEGGEAALAFSSGMAAITATLMSVLRPGDHVVAPEAIYTSTLGLLRFLTDWGIKVTLVDATDSTNIESALTGNTKLIYLESPANPTLKLIDVAVVVDIAKRRNVVTVMDNTFASPVNQNPLAYGVDAVIHSATKYLGGHGDLMAGVLVSSTPFVENVRWSIQRLFGAVIAPETAWLVMRGLRTLAVRMKQHNTSALKVAQFLENHPRVTTVHYPGLMSHPQHELAKRQMRGFGGIVAFDVGGVDEGRKVVNGVRLCTLAVSLGDVASLIQHSASMTQASIPRQERLAAGVSDGLLRLSVGLEDPNDIISDLDQALNKI